MNDRKITTIKDPLIKEARALNKPSVDCSEFLLEGEDIINWAISAGVHIKHVFVCDKYAGDDFMRLLESKKVPFYLCSDGIMKKINESKFLTPYIGVGKINQNDHLLSDDFVIILDHIQDQGNLGTITRTCSAFGVNEIGLINTPSIFSKKTITASRGSVFTSKHIKFGNPQDAIQTLKSSGYQIIATTPRGQHLQSLISLENCPVALIIGNETNGVSKDFIDQADFTVQIPMHSEMESLNVGVSTGISLYELKLKVLIAMLSKKIKLTLGRNIGVAHQLMRHALDMELKKLTPLTSEQVVLLMIMQCDERMSASQITKDIGFANGDLNNLLSPLLRDNLVHYAEETKHYVITPKGEEIIGKIWPVIEKCEQAILNDFTSDEKQQLKLFLTKIQNNCQTLITENNKANHFTKIIETDRLFMRSFCNGDVDAFSAICADPEVMKYIGGGSHDREQTQAKIAKWINDYETDGFGLMALIHKNSNELIGFCGLIKQVVDDKECIELGYRLAKKYWGQGLATEAAQAARDYAFKDLNIQQLISIIHPENIASKKVASKTGMRFIKKTIFQGIDVEIYGVTNDR